MPTEPLLSCLSAQSRNRTCKHSGLSRVALPVGVSRQNASRSRSRTCNHPGFRISSSEDIGRPGSLCHWRTRDAVVVPDGIEPSFPVCKTGVGAVGPQDYVVVEWTHRESHPDLWHATPASSCWTMSPSFGAEAVRLELTSGLCRHLFSRQAPHPAG